MPKNCDFYLADADVLGEGSTLTDEQHQKVCAGVDPCRGRITKEDIQIFNYVMQQNSKDITCSVVSWDDDPNAAITHEADGKWFFYNKDGDPTNNDPNTKTTNDDWYGKTETEGFCSIAELLNYIIINNLLGGQPSEDLGSLVSVNVPAGVNAFDVSLNDSSVIDINYHNVFSDSHPSEIRVSALVSGVVVVGNYDYSNGAAATTDYAKPFATNPINGDVNSGTLRIVRRDDGRIQIGSYKNVFRDTVGSTARTGSVTVRTPSPSGSIDAIRVYAQSGAFQNARYSYSGIVQA